MTDLSTEVGATQPLAVVVSRDEVTAPCTPSGHGGRRLGFEGRHRGGPQS